MTCHSSFRICRLPALLCMLSACATAPAGEALVDASYKVVEQQQVALSRSVSLRYDAVADSRCPQHVVCIWAGTIKYHFTLITANGIESFVLAPQGDDYASSALKGVRFGLGDAEPPAASSVVTVKVKVISP